MGECDSGATRPNGRVLKKICFIHCKKHMFWVKQKAVFIHLNTALSARDYFILASFEQILRYNIVTNLPFDMKVFLISYIRNVCTTKCCLTYTICELLTQETNILCQYQCLYSPVPEVMCLELSNQGVWLTKGITRQCI